MFSYIHNRAPNNNSVPVTLPAPLGKFLMPVRVTPTGQVASRDLQTAMLAAGHPALTMQAHTPKRLVIEHLSLNDTLDPKLYLHVLSLCGHPGTWDQKWADTYFGEQPRFDISLGTVRQLGQPGLFMPYALAYCAKGYLKRKPPFSTWTEAMEAFSTAMLMDGDYAEYIVKRTELVKLVSELVPTKCSTHKLDDLLSRVRG